MTQDTLAALHNRRVLDSLRYHTTPQTFSELRAATGLSLGELLNALNRLVTARKVLDCHDGRFLSVVTVTSPETPISGPLDTKGAETQTRAGQGRGEGSGGSGEGFPECPLCHGKTRPIPCPRCLPHLAGKRFDPPDLPKVNVRELLHARKGMTAPDGEDAGEPPCGGDIHTEAIHRLASLKPLGSCATEPTGLLIDPSENFEQDGSDIGIPISGSSVEQPALLTRGTGARDDWRPIASAPKDGTLLLLWSDRTGQVARLGYDLGSWCGVTGDWREEVSGDFLWPAYWQPLSPPDNIVDGTAEYESWFSPENEWDPPSPAMVEAARMHASLLAARDVTSVAPSTEANDTPARGSQTWRVPGPWNHCPSTHCERRQECCSPSECASNRKDFEDAPDKATSPAYAPGLKHVLAAYDTATDRLLMQWDIPESAMPRVRTIVTPNLDDPNMVFCYQLSARHVLEVVMLCGMPGMPYGPGRAEYFVEGQATAAALDCDEEETTRCEHCQTDVPIEKAVESEGIYLCPACWDQWRGVFQSCKHDWSPAHDQYGDPGQYCSRCAGFVNDESLAEAVGSATAAADVSEEESRTPIKPSDHHLRTALSVLNTRDSWGSKV